MWSSFSMILGGLLISGVDASPAPQTRDFAGWFASAVAGKLEIPTPVASRAQAFRYVFVGGFRNEKMPGYFAKNMSELRTLGIPRDQIEVIHPSSDQTLESNAEEVGSRFLEIAGKGPERLVVVAHSRGACDALSFALDHPRFVRDHIEALYLIQGPFGGSGLAGYVLGSGTPMDRQMTWRHRIIGNLIGRMIRFKSRVSGREVIQEMTPEASAAYWTTALDQSATNLREIGSKTFYIRSALQPSRQRFLRRAMAWYLQTYHGASDGVVALKDQSLPGFGTVIATLEAGHSDLTCNSPTSRARRGDRRALSRSLVMAVGQARVESDPSAIKIGASVPDRRRLDLGQDAVPELQSSLEGGRRREPRITPANRVVPADR